MGEFKLLSYADFPIKTSEPHKYCKICGEKIEQKHDFFKNASINNHSNCISCFKKILIRYFLEEIEFNIIEKDSIIRRSENEELVIKYFNLLNEYDYFDNNTFKEYEKFKVEIPESLKLNFLNLKEVRIKEVNKKIDYYTIENGQLSSSFKEKLSNYNLSEEDGWAIRQKLIELNMNNSLKEMEVNKKLHELLWKSNFNIF